VSNQDLHIAKLEVAPPPWSKAKGLFVGAVVEIPVIAGTLWGCGRLGWLTPRDFVPLMRLAAVFAGIAALATAIGVARVAAQASVRGGGGRWRSVKIAAATHAVAGVGLAVITAVAAGQFTADRNSWAIVGCAGLVAGTICGALIGVVCGGPAPISAADLIALAKRPTDVLVHAVIDPAADLVRMGGRVADRAGHAASDLVEGLFDPAEPAPRNSITTIPRSTDQASTAPTDAAAIRTEPKSDDNG
jgi:hypothetical protein